MRETWELFGEEDEEESPCPSRDGVRARGGSDDVEDMNVDASGSGGGDDPGEPDPPGAGNLFPDKIKNLMPVIRWLHVNLGHPSFPVMSRPLRDAGADP